MKIVEDLNTNKYTKKKLRKRAARVVKDRNYWNIEKSIEVKLGSRYEEIGKPMPPQIARKFQLQLNNAGYKSERSVIKELVNLGVCDFYPNKLLLNRFYGDIVFIDRNIVIELDGYSHDNEKRQEKDKRKDYWLTLFGFTVHRSKVYNDEQAVAAAKSIFELVGFMPIGADIKSLPKPKRAVLKKRIKRKKMPWVSKNDVREQLKQLVPQFIENNGVTKVSSSTFVPRINVMTSKESKVISKRYILRKQIK